MFFWVARTEPGVCASTQGTSHMLRMCKQKPHLGTYVVHDVCWMWNHVTVLTSVVSLHLMLCVGVSFCTLCLGLVLSTSYLQTRTHSHVAWCRLPCAGTDPVTFALVLSPQHSHFWAEELHEMQQCSTVERKKARSGHPLLQRIAWENHHASEVETKTF